MVKCYKHPHKDADSVCRICKENYCDECVSIAGVCQKCIYKTLVLILVAMIIISYVAWIGLFG